jgi:hypothetical protein
MRVLLLLALLPPQEQIDKADAQRRAAFAVDKYALRLRVTKAIPETKTVRVQWRRGGEGLGGEVVRGEWAEDLDLNGWSKPLPLKELLAKAGGWQFVTIVVATTGGKKAAPLNESAVEFELAEDGKPAKTFVETAPKGATVGLALPLGAATREEFAAGFQGLSTYARARRERLEKLFPDPAPLPSKFGLIGHVGGYGEGGTGKGGGSGYGVRHCNPEILADECRTLRMLGVNGMVGSIRLADAAGVGREFRRVYWGGPGSGDPMGIFRRGKEVVDGCPFDPAVRAHVEQATKAAIDEHHAVGAKESWALWDDEMGVYAKEHVVGCTRCAEAFREYLKGQGVEPLEPYDVWGKKPPPADPKDALRYYWTFRFMTHATAQVYPEAARKFKDAGIHLYAMQGPTPSWSGASLDWNEFYDHQANTAFVFETSNRDPRSWPWESYLADIGRGICARHGMPMGCLVKPHRGAPEQRMLTVVSRGATVLEWYTYGPDYAKGDSFSQRPDLLDRVARAARFLGRAEECLYGAKWAVEPEVAFCTPRSSEIWGHAAGDLTAFENAKWIYLALRHAHLPIDIVSEQQLAEGKLAKYKAIYVPGPHLRRDAAAKLKEWVSAGGLLWTDCMGLSRDEANQPLDLIPGERKEERWGRVEGYKATDFKPIAGGGESAVGREIRAGKTERFRMGRGEIFLSTMWAGLTYSAKVRRADFDMRADFDPAIRSVIAGPALERGVARPVVPADPLIEAVLLEKDGRRSVALMNWAYKGRELEPVENLKVQLPAGVKSARSLVHGDLKVDGGAVVLPKMQEIDLLVLE